jgi:hypothetical protein
MARHEENSRKLFKVFYYAMYQIDKLKWAQRMSVSFLRKKNFFMLPE